MAHFEKRIVNCYLKFSKEEIYAEVPLIKIDDYEKIWANLKQNKKNEILKKTLLDVDNLSEVCFQYNDSIHKVVNGKSEEILNSFELMFKLIHHVR